MSLLEKLDPVFHESGICCNGTEAATYLLTPIHLGTGSYGSVFISYRALGDGRWVGVAVKVFGFTGVRHVDGLVQRVHHVGREAAFMACATGAFVAGVHRPWLDTARGTLCIPQELCDESLDMYSRRSRPVGIPPLILCSLLDQCLKALEQLQRAGIVHNDIKPQNMLLVWPETHDVGAPWVRLTDFGLSVSSYEVVDQTEALPMGTPYYMAPETGDFSGATAPHARDVWSLGCSFYELLTGAVPFPGGTYEEVRRRTLSGVPTQWTTATGVGRIHLQLYKLVRRMMHLDPNLRPVPVELRLQLLAVVGSASLPVLQRPVNKTYRRYVVCRPGIQLVVYSEPAARAEFATCHVLDCFNDNIIADDAWGEADGAAAGHQRPHTHSAGLLPRLFRRCGHGDVPAAARAHSTPTIAAPLCRHRSRSPPPPPPPAVVWVRLVYPHAGYCQRVWGGHHVLHPFELATRQGCPPLASFQLSDDDSSSEGAAPVTLATPSLDVHECQASAADGAGGAEAAGVISPSARRPHEGRAASAGRCPDHKPHSRFRSFFARRYGNTNG